MMNDKLKKMYASGGLLGALLKDPAQRKMAEDMIQKAEGGMSVKPYRNGGMMYDNGGQTGPPNTTARDAYSAFQKEIKKKYPNPDSKLSLKDATQYLTLQFAANREASAEVGQRKFEREKEIDGLYRSSVATSPRFEDSQQRRSENQMINEAAAQNQFFRQQVEGKSYRPGAMVPKTEMERAQRLEMFKGIEQVKDDKELEEYLKANEIEELTPYDLQFIQGSDSYVEQPERFTPDALRRILKYRPINYYGQGGAAKEYRMGGGIDGEPVSPLTEIETEKIVKNPTNMGFEYVGQDYLEQFPDTIKEPRDLLRFFTVKEAARLLEEEEGITARGMRPQEILNAARAKGINPLTSARDLFDREMDKRR